MLFKVGQFRKLILYGLLDPDGEGTTVLRNVRRYLPKDRASHHEIGVLDNVMFVLIEWLQLALARFAGFSSIIAFVLIEWLQLALASCAAFSSIVAFVLPSFHVSPYVVSRRSCYCSFYLRHSLKAVRRKWTPGAVPHFAVCNLIF